MANIQTSRHTVAVSGAASDTVTMNQRAAEKQAAN